MSLNQGNMEPGGERKEPKKGFKFNIYWLYALIAAVLIGFNLFRGLAPDALSISQRLFEDSMLRKGYVKSYLIVKNKDIVRVTLKPEGFRDPAIAKLVSESKIKIKEDKGPHLQFPIGDAKAYDERVQKITDDHADLTGKPDARYDTEEN